MANSTIGVLFVHFPGSSLVYGAHEVFLGSYYNGAARLVKGIVSALVIALFYTLGWQFWGQDWVRSSTVLSNSNNYRTKSHILLHLSTSSSG